LKEGVDMKDALDRSGLKKICCRRMMMGHVELIDKILKY
jgi:DNA-directed RNA polymerase I, II, and III subunit RPABC5